MATIEQLKARLNPANSNHAALIKSLSSLQVMKGEDGYTPKKGVDYFTPAEIREIFSIIEQKISTFERGLKGERGLQGERGQKGESGKDGYTPLKGLDYFTTEEINDIVFKVLSKIKQPKDGVSPNVDDVVNEVLKKVKLPDNSENVTKTELVNFLKRGGYRGGGLSTVSTDSTLTGDGTLANPLSVVASGGITILTATGTIDDTNTTFTFVSKPVEIVINGSSYIENGGWTWSGLTATLDFPVGDGGKIYGRS